MLQNTAIETDNRLHQRLTSDRHVLENGLVVLITENPTADIVAARLFINAGSRHEQPHQAGLSHLVASLQTTQPRILPHKLNPLEPTWASAAPLIIS
jgi:predicted Zn-dependent peptidase